MLEPAMWLNAVVSVRLTLIAASDEELVVHFWLRGRF